MLGQYATIGLPSVLCGVNSESKIETNATLLWLLQGMFNWCPLSSAYPYCVSIITVLETLACPTYKLLHNVPLD